MALQSMQQLSSLAAPQDSRAINTSSYHGLTIGRKREAFYGTGMTVHLV
jgi:hypothetical protein